MPWFSDRIILPALLCVMMPTLTSHADNLAIVPQPRHIERGMSQFVLDPATAIVTEPSSPAVRGIAEQLRQWMAPSTGYRLPIVEDAQRADAPPLILRLLSDASVPEEGYKLTVAPEAVTIEATSHSGLFYGAQTFRQLLPPALESGIDTQGLAQCVTERPNPATCGRVENQPR